MAGYRILGGGGSGGGGDGQVITFTESIGLGIKVAETGKAPLDNTALTPDDCGGNHATSFVGAVRPTVVASPWGAAFGNALRFVSNGTISSGISVPLGVHVTGRICVEMRINSASYWSAVTHINTFSGGLGNYEIDMGFVVINKLRGVLVGSAGNVLLNGITTLVDGRPYAIALDYDGILARLWLKDGANPATLEASAAIPGGIALDSRPVGPLNIGESNPVNIFDGTIEEVRISNISRYASGFDPGSTPFECDNGVVALYHMDRIVDPLRFDIAIAVADTSTEPTEAVKAGISGPDLSESNDTPTEARSALIRVWLSNSAGTDVANPANANGVNNAVNAVVSTAALASNPETLTSDIGTGVPSGITFSSAIYRGWFRARTTLITSTAEVIAHSTTAAFSDIVMFTQSSLGGDTNHLGGTFTFDLVAAGVNTLAKLQSLQVLHRTTDAVAGVTPAILDVDAGAADITATSI